MNNQDVTVLPLSVEGEYERRAEVRRQFLLEGFMPEQTVDYWAAINRHTLKDSERWAIDTRTDEEVRLGISRPRVINANDLKIQERTARTLYRDDEGFPLIGYIPEFVFAERQPVPTVYNLQKYMHTLDTAELSTVDHLGEAPILGMSEMRNALNVREIAQIMDRVEEATGNYPTLEEMGIVKGHEVLCEDRIVRAITTAEHVGYDTLHEGDKEQTVEKHNTSTDTRTSVTRDACACWSEEGAMVLWNAGDSGKHFIVDYTQEVAA